MKIKDKKLLYKLYMIIGVMCVLVVSSVPLYNLFCTVTGFLGTTRRAESYKGNMGKRQYTVRFNADVSRDVPWEFYPYENKINTYSGENKLTFYGAENLSDDYFSGMAIYNVTPHAAAKYFYKVHCFCFEKQTLSPKEKVEMPVSFYIDPEIENDSSLKHVDTLTLSYMFFKYKN